MRPSTCVVVICLALLLACSGATSTPERRAPEPAPIVGVPEPEPEPAPEPEGPTWIDEAVDRALDGEVMPGTTAEDDPERPGQLRTFFEAHPEYRDPARMERLLEAACAFRVEPAHEYLTNPPPKTPLEVDVTTDDWRVVVAHAESVCTSDDWSWFTNDVGTAVKAQGITYSYGGADNQRVIVRRNGVEVAQADLTGQGYLLLAAGKPPMNAAHDMVEGVLTEASGYFGVPIPGVP